MVLRYLLLMVVVVARFQFLLHLVVVRFQFRLALWFQFRLRRPLGRRRFR